MAELVAARRLPTGPSEVDWSNSLSHGLVFAAVGTEPINLVSQRLAALSKVVPGRCENGLGTRGAARFDKFYEMAQLGAGVSFFVQMLPTKTVWAPTVGVVAGNLFSNQIGIGVYTDGANFANDPFPNGLNFGPYRAGIRTFGLAIQFGESSGCKSYTDGRLISSITYNAPSMSAPLAAGYAQRLDGLASLNADAEVYVAYIFSRRLSGAEMAALHADPMQLLYLNGGRIGVGVTSPPYPTLGTPSISNITASGFRVSVGLT